MIDDKAVGVITDIDPAKLFNNFKIIGRDQSEDYLIEDNNGNSALSAVFSKLDNVDWYQDTDFTFSTGASLFKNKVTIVISCYRETKL